MALPEALGAKPALPLPAAATALGPVIEHGEAGPMGLGPTVAAGLAVIAAFFGGFGLWAALLPLDSAAVAPGVVMVFSNRKTVQHLEGGIVRKILVRDGDRVAADQVLIRLDDAQARAKLDLLDGRYVSMRALEARLRAERDGAGEIDFPVELAARSDDSKVMEIILGQDNAFNSRRQLMEDQIAVLRQRMAQNREEIAGLEGEIKAEDTQLRLIAEEVEAVKELVEKGLERKPRLLALQRQAAEIEGKRSQNVAMIARSRQNIGEAELRINELRTTRVNEAADALQDAQRQIFDIVEQMRAAEDILQRLDVRAPIGGTIVGLQVHTPGGVVAPGAPLMEIVPEGDRLVIEAQIDPKDIDVVHPGLAAEVRITAFAYRRVEPVKGEVTWVSADRMVEQQTGRAYYKIRVEPTEDPSKALGGARLYPGMAAEVMIVTGAHTAFEYLLRPLVASLNRALRED
ncbi:MAG: HlyD family type I secretion periplasmic adaptor subunit [Proteobacteria bacterium]|nr:HlyD family type I secretion periplasmic adaptor subunit [Pseudomonadota bacterium]